MATPPHSSLSQTPPSISLPIPPIANDATSDVGVDPSVVSSRMTDVGPTDDHADGEPGTSTAGATPSTVPGLTGPAGEPGLPPSRPSSITTGGSGKRRSQMGPPSSRRGMLPSQGLPRPMSTSGGSSRPISSASRTHVPSLTSHAFYRPMSSQRLQAQRSQRPTSLLGDTVLSADERRNTVPEPEHRRSFGSFTTDGARVEKDEPLPPSRGTEDNEPDPPDWSTVPSLPTAGATIRSRGESDAPLQSPDKNTPKPLNFQSSSRDYANAFPPAQKSPRSFSSSFILQNMNGASGSRRTHGHEKLGSTGSSPKMTPQKQPTPERKKDLGKNWEYFTGNTIFCWGGRLQNSRDRPVNIVTGILAILPVGLFYGYS
ncbi:MAG: Eukaryotic peptide chain release factor GTP-binding subunit [Bathelium mastoideum]|nr:MAG: Eukaryotic peptide chain release factor GTP-binding subunit [Bathelium mastoideum]